MSAEYLDGLLNWPKPEDEGSVVEAAFKTPDGEGYIMGTLIKVDEITDESELHAPTGIPLFHIVSVGVEVCWHDVITYRFVA